MSLASIKTHCRLSPDQPKARNADCAAKLLGTGRNAEPKRHRDRGIVKKENQVAKSKPDDTQSIIRKFQKIHGGTFDYSKVDYYNHATKIINRGPSVDIMYNRKLSFIHFNYFGHILFTFISNL